MVPFNIPTITGNEKKYLEDVINRKSFCGDRHYTKVCEKILSHYLNESRVLLTASCTQALEIAALLLDLKEGDEVIMPSYTFVSTANAFTLRGATVCFVDVDSSSMNIDLDSVENAITSSTKAIIPVHYAGMSCDMTRLMNIADKYNLFVVEDAAQAITSRYNGKPLGSFGHLSCFSFHETKNIQCGEGGALVINDQRFIERAEVIREKGTNRKQFMNGLVDKYTWIDIGTSGLMSEVQAAFLSAQLQDMHDLCDQRKNIWSQYEKSIKEIVPYLRPSDKNVSHNAHLFAVFTKDEERSRIIQELKAKKISTSFHYIPLHSAPGATKVNMRFHGKDLNTSYMSKQILRLPIYHNMNTGDIDNVIRNLMEVI